MDGTLEYSKTQNVSTCSMGSVTSTPKNGSSSVALEGVLPVSWGGSGATGTLSRVLGKIGLVGMGVRLYQLYMAPPTMTKATPTSMAEEDAI